MGQDGASKQQAPRAAPCIQWLLNATVACGQRTGAHVSPARWPFSGLNVLDPFAFCYQRILSYCVSGRSSMQAWEVLGCWSPPSLGRVQGFCPQTGCSRQCSIAGRALAPAAWRTSQRKATNVAQLKVDFQACSLRCWYLNTTELLLCCAVLFWVFFKDLAWILTGACYWAYWYQGIIYEFQVKYFFWIVRQILHMHLLPVSNSKRH